MAPTPQVGAIVVSRRVWVVARLLHRRPTSRCHVDIEAVADLRSASMGLRAVKGVLLRFCRLVRANFGGRVDPPPLAFRALQRDYLGKPRRGLLE